MRRIVPVVDDADRQTQLLRGALDMCLLALLAKEPAHGYELVRRSTRPASRGSVTARSIRC